VAREVIKYHQALSWNSSIKPNKQTFLRKDLFPSLDSLNYFHLKPNPYSKTGQLKLQSNGHLIKTA
jgi:hypothetical protein